MSVLVKEYPGRPQFWAMKFIRKMGKTCIAQEIGAAGFALLAEIASTEDVAGYSRAVTFYDSQLMMTLGLHCHKSLARIRQKCVDAGWLHYEPGCKGRAGRYWTLEPDYATALPDSSFDEGEQFSGEMPGHNARENVHELSSIRPGKRPPFFPTPTPTPTPKEHAPIPAESFETVIPDRLRELAEALNSLPAGIIPVTTKLDSKAILGGWKRIQKDPEAYAAFKNIPELVAKIRGSPFLHGKSWFKLLWLFGKGPDRLQWNITKIVEGSYLGELNRKQQQTTGRHDLTRPIASGADF